jgi:tripartite-type tricarboxylate transporter receptor subunit TctC
MATALRCLGFLVATAIVSSPAISAEVASNYPSKPVRIVVGFSAGSGVDVSARLVAQKLNERWGQPVVADNRPGAGGTIAAGIVAEANPDGYTLISVSAGHVISPSIYPKLKYDTIKDFAGITTTVSLPNILVVSPSLGVKSVKDLIALARAKPGQLMFSSGGVGSGTHFASELFKARAGIDVSHVPYKGIPEALTETVAGRVAFTMSPVANVLPQVKAGKVVALAVAPARRVAVMPADDGRGGRNRLQLGNLVWLPGAGEDAARHRQPAKPGGHEDPGVAGPEEALGGDGR